MMMDRCACLLMSLLCLLAWAHQTTAQNLTVLRTIGAEGDEVLLHRPIDVVWFSDGRACLLNQGDCSLAEFTPDGDLLAEHSRKGEAPGELSMPDALLLVGNEVWVKMPASFAVFDSHLDHLRTVHIPPGIGSVASADSCLLGVQPFSNEIGLRLDLAGRPRETFGPTLVQGEDAVDLLRATSWKVVAGSGSLALVDCFEGRVWVPGPLGAPLLNLDLSRGKVQGPSRIKRVVTSLCPDRQGGWLVTTHAREQAMLVRYDASWRKDWVLELPAEIPGGIVRAAPEGRIWFLNDSSSIVWICRLTSEP